MVIFADSIENEEIRNKLYKALNGKGAFSRFKKEITDLGIREKWFVFRDERLKEKRLKRERKERRRSYEEAERRNKQIIEEMRKSRYGRGV